MRENRFLTEIRLDLMRVPETWKWLAQRWVFFWWHKVYKFCRKPWSLPLNIRPFLAKSPIIQCPKFNQQQALCQPLSSLKKMIEKNNVPQHFTHASQVVEVPREEKGKPHSAAGPCAGSLLMEHGGMRSRLQEESGDYGYTHLTWWRSQLFGGFNPSKEYYIQFGSSSQRCILLKPPARWNAINW